MRIRRQLLLAGVFVALVVGWLVIGFVVPWLSRTFAPPEEIDAPTAQHAPMAQHPDGGAREETH